METLTMILNSPPYGSEKVWNGLRLALTSVSGIVDLRVNVFLLGDAVVAAKKGQNTPEGYYNLEKMLRDLLERGGKVAACGTCLRARGLTKEDLVEGVETGAMSGLAHWIEESQKVLSF